ncbi:MAG: RagB/SusD family nutrient uptake outer membrane protein, partial [Chitinophagaceae bacterium]|nr:RagB/SusD family nutrient uptake outer membrane protein [Chitinophagaceae bacterium]
RLAEQYLIRAEARAHLDNLDGAKADMYEIRKRAGLEELPRTLGKDDILLAIEKERQIELMAEWGHRWLDLKRTGRTTAAFSTIPLKQPWAGDYQLLYPIPAIEIEANINLIQNPGYIQ